MPIEKENTVEEFADAEAKRRGGFTLKLNPKGYVGVPDRLVVLPVRIFFLELKRPKGGRVAHLQLWWQHRITARGHGSYICKNKSQVLDAFNAWP